MVAGWDRLLQLGLAGCIRSTRPRSTRFYLWARWRWCLVELSLTGVHAQEAFQLIDNAGGVFYALTYLVLFAIPLFGMKALACQSAVVAQDRVRVGLHRYFDLYSFCILSDYYGTQSSVVCPEDYRYSRDSECVGVAIYVLRKRK